MSLFERVLVDFVGSVYIVVNFEAVGRIFECVGAGEFIPAKMPWKTVPRFGQLWSLAPESRQLSHSA